MKPTVALLIPHHFNFYKGILKNLESAGFQTEVLVITDQKFRYKGILQRAKSFGLKLFGSNDEYKKMLKRHQHSESLLNALDKYHGKLDYALVIRPDHYTPEALQLLRKKTGYTAAYQWDGFDRYPEVLDYISLFDAFFTFDPDDFRKYSPQFENLKFTTNFYLDHIPVEKFRETPESVFFLGSYLPNRMDPVIELAKHLDNQSINTNIQIIYTHSKIPPILKNAPLKVRRQTADYLDMLDGIQNASCLLEFKNTGIHKGLSFRVFESLHFQKKLITDNPDVKKFDFFHSDNIFVWDKENAHQLKAFLQTPYQPLKKEIKEKYSFTNWIRYMLNVSPHQKIE